MQTPLKFFDHCYTLLNVPSPVVYVDVGAMGGIPEYWQHMGRHCHVIAFEPDEREFARLQSSAHRTFLPYALYHSRVALPFYISREGGKSSIYRPNAVVMRDFPGGARMDTVDEKIIPQDKVRTLDEALTEAKVKDIDFLKLDTQGSELDILKGAGRSLRHLFGVEVEVEFAALYQGQPLFRDIDAFMDAQGFELMDLRRAFWKRKSFSDYVGRGQLIFGDALYVRRIDFFLDMLEDRSPQDQETKIARALMVTMVYRIPDYAMDLLNKALDKNLLSDHQHAQWRTLIEAEAQSWGSPKLLGRSWMAKLFNRLAESIRPTSYLGWSDGDRFIANTRNK